MKKEENLRLKMEPWHCKNGCYKTKKAGASSVKACIRIVRKKKKLVNWNILVASKKSKNDPISSGEENGQE